MDLIAYMWANADLSLVHQATLRPLVSCQTHVRMYVCIPILVTTFRSAVWNHGRTHPAPSVRPRCVCSILRAHAQFFRFDKADATADAQRHCNHRPPAQSSLVRISWSIGSEMSFGHSAPGGSRTLDFLCARRAPTCG